MAHDGRIGNFTLDLADVNGESLWLCSYYYEAADAYKGEMGPKGLPVLVGARTRF